MNSTPIYDPDVIDAIVKVIAAAIAAVIAYWKARKLNRLKHVRAQVA